MKLTRVLYKQHIGRQLKRLWYVKRERKLGDTHTEEYLSTLGISIKDPFEIIYPKQEFPKYFPLQNCIFQKLHIAFYILIINCILYKAITRGSEAKRNSV